jgi:hypothetical protein
MQSGSLHMIKLNLYSARRTLRQGLVMAAASLAACFAPWAYAWNVDLYSVTAGQVGSHEGYFAFLTIQEPVHSSCSGAVLYYDITPRLGATCMRC